MKNVINMLHVGMTDEQAYQNVKEICHKYPDIGFMKPSEWKERRLKELAKQGRKWSK